MSALVDSLEVKAHSEYAALGVAVEVSKLADYCPIPSV